MIEKSNVVKLNKIYYNNTDNFITIIRATEKQPSTLNGKRVPLAKIIGEKVTEHNTWFDFEVVQYANIQELHAILIEVAKDPYACVVRGCVHPLQTCFKGINRTKAQTDHSDGNVISHPLGQKGIMLDFDEIEKLGIIDSTKVLTDPVFVIEQIIKYLPPYFHNCSYSYQMSGNAGTKVGDMFRAHIWFVLDKRYHDDNLRYWAEHVVNKQYKLVDVALFDAIQMHYSGNPIVPTGATDPYPDNRSGFEKKAADIVITLEKDFVLPKVTPTQHIAKTSDEVMGNGSGMPLQYYAENIGDHDNGKGFKKGIWSYICSYVSASKFGVDCDREELKAKIRAIVAVADQSKQAQGEIEEKTSDKKLDAEIASAIKKAKQKKNNKKSDLVEGVESHYTQAPQIPKNKISESIAAAVGTAMYQTNNQGVKATAGCGKSNAANVTMLKLVEQGYLGEMYCPTTARCEENAKELIHINPYISVQVMYGREHINPATGEPMCAKCKTAKEVVSLGHGVLNTLCMRWVDKEPQHLESSTKMFEKKVIWWEKNKDDILGSTIYTSEEKASMTKEHTVPPSDKVLKKCSYFEVCPYIKQWQEKPNIRLFVHAYLALNRSMLDKPDSNYLYQVVVDEQHFKMFLSGSADGDKPVLFENIINSNWDAGFIKALISIPVGVDIYKALLKSYTKGQLVGLIKDSLTTTKQEHHEFVNIIDMYGDEQFHAAKYLQERTNLSKFLELMLQELQRGRTESVTFITIEKGFEMHYRKEATRFRYKYKGDTIDMPITFIDADLSKTINEIIFPNTTYHEVNVGKNARFIQCSSSTFSKSSITSNGGVLMLAKTQQLINRVESELNPQGEPKRVLVVGNQMVTGNVKTGVEPRITVGVNSLLMHYNNLRGFNGAKNFDAIIVIGRVEPSCHAIEKQARALLYDLDEKLLLNEGDLIPELRGYMTTSGWKVGREIRVHRDKRIQEILEQIREAEIIQAIDRLRLVYATYRKDVYILTNLVLPTPIDHLLDLDEVIKGKTLVSRAWSNLNGLMVLNMKWLVDTIPEIFPKEHNAQNFLIRECSSFEKIKNSLLIDNLNDVRMVEFVTKGGLGAGKKRKCLSVFSLEETREKLSSMLGLNVSLIKQS